MKTIRRLFTIVMACCIFTSVFSISSFADESNVISKESFYEVFDEDGNELAFFAQKPNQAELNLFSDHGSIIVVETTETVRKLRLDLSKTVEKQYKKLCKNPSGNVSLPSGYDTSGSITYKLRASITYNPNTMKITSATRILRTYTSWSGWEVEMEPFIVNEVSSDPVIATNQYSASFSHSMAVKANYAPGGMVLGTLNYGTVSNSFTITP